MHNRFSIITASAILVMWFLTGCGGTSSVTQPLQSDQIQTQSARANSSGRMLWGLYECSINTRDSSVTVLPMRTAEFTANVNNLLESKPGNLSITDLDLTDYFSTGRLGCTVKLRHPFPGLSKYNGFDVWGVFMHDGKGTLDYNSLNYPDAGLGGAQLLNADGYTRWFNREEFFGAGIPLLVYYGGKLANLPNPTAELNGYKIFADGLGVDEDYYSWINDDSNVLNRGIFSAGMVNSRRYQLQFPMVGGTPELKFQYVVIASWEPGNPGLSGNPTYYDPMDFPVSANCDEAFFIHSDDSNSTLYNNGSGLVGGEFKSSIEVFDWQGGVIGGNGVPNEIHRIIIEGDFIPGGSAEWDQIALAAIAQSGTITSSVFEIEVTGCTPAAVSSMEYWVIVESKGQWGESYDQGFSTPCPTGARRAAFYRGAVDISATGPSGPVVTGINPNSVPFYSIIDDAVISGGGFVSGCTVKLRMGTAVVDAANVVFQSSTSLLVDFDLVGVESGLWDVVVINPNMAEGVLKDGLTIEPWSKEFLLKQGGSRLPQIAEIANGKIVLATGCDNDTAQYFLWDKSWAGPYTLTNRQTHTHLYLTSDPVNDNVYFSCAVASDFWKLYRYTGGTGLWQERNANFISQKHNVFWCDLAGQLHTVCTTISAYGFLVHVRALDWTSGWILPPQWYSDDYNDKEATWGNWWAMDSTGKAYTIYEKDGWKNPYTPQSNRYIRIGWILNGSDFVSGNIATIETSTIQAHYLDSPAVTVDSSGNVYAAYRMYDGSQWRIAIKKSTNGGVTWGSASNIWATLTPIREDYTFLHCDYNNKLHALVGIDKYLLYKYSSNGTSWSSSEIANQSADGNPSGTSDFMPMMMVTSDGIMHVAWIRGNEIDGWGSIYHRFRDID